MRSEEGFRARHYLYVVPEGQPSGDLVSHVSFADDSQAKEWARGQHLTEGARCWTLFRLAAQGLVTVESSTAAVSA